MTTKAEETTTPMTLPAAYMALRDGMTQARNALQIASEDGDISKNTIWMHGTVETLFDFMDAIIAATASIEQAEPIKDHESTPQNMENVLKSRGVFKGVEGLRGLAESQEFWDKQPYGTRLYYGDGVRDCLHRGVLQIAIAALDAAPSPQDTKEE